MDDADATGSPRRLLSAVLQLVGFVACVGLLVWMVLIALRPENQEQLRKLSEATSGQLSALFALTALSIVFNGGIFWALILPVRRLRFLDVVAVNAVATAMSYMPFKMSLVARVAIHRARDRLPIATIGAWMIAVVGSLMATLGPIAAASAWRKGIDAYWIVTSVVGVLGANVLVVLAGRWLEGEAGLARIRAVLRLVNLGRLVDGERFGQAHLGMSMVSRFEAIGGAMVFRLLDVLVQAGRFLIAARVLGIELSFEDSVLLGATFFLVGAMSPFGEAGLREGGTIAMAKLIGIAAAAESASPEANPIVVLTLFVSGSELVVRVVSAGFAAVWLRADKLIAPGRRGGRGRKG